MELYHIHLLGNYDGKYKKNSELIIDNNFNNRIYDRIYNMNYNVDTNRYIDIVNRMNKLCRLCGMETFKDKINLGEIMECVLKEGITTQDELKNILIDAKTLLFKGRINLREQALEEYRKEYCSNIPSRLHSLFACSEEGVELWASLIMDGESDIYRIEVLDEPFVSNEALLPSEKLTYGEQLKEAAKYFNPRKKDLVPQTNEYLVQGKVKILEKIGEIRYQ